MTASVPVEIDPDSGFCFGVTSAIQKAEAQLSCSAPLFCLGDIVHNSNEVERLRRAGLTTISHEQLAALTDATVLLRAHGEPPSTYATARRNNIRIIDATCPVVLRLQRSIHDTYRRPEAPQIVIYGKAGHAEVNGLVGQTEGNAIVIDDSTDLSLHIDPERPVALYSQTTMPLDGFNAVCRRLRTYHHHPESVECHDTICRQMANRAEALQRFAAAHHTILFVSGHKSSNGKVIYDKCRATNPRTYLIADHTEVLPQYISGATSIGICGATSTPRWLMDQVKDHCLRLLNQSPRP
ncbi:MAG: 4-hydroxy-3-methylbut-2-enyl diphosphate reductase [Muribaculaceae bacterium]|nr:4-hydroxy-3-methylbut-2-enyl diphosphate reductase [Muribaculaceae bacterium]